MVRNLLVISEARSPKARTSRKGLPAAKPHSPAAAQHLGNLASLRRVRDRIDRDYAQPLDVEALARGAHMSTGHLSREFKLAYGESPYSYLMTRRIERAMALLRRDDQSVTEVCLAVGRLSLGTFSTRFTELVGMTPGAYRRQARGVLAGVPPCIANRCQDRSGIEKHPLLRRSYHDHHGLEHPHDAPSPYRPRGLPADYAPAMSQSSQIDQIGASRPSTTARWPAGSPARRKGRWSRSPAAGRAGW